MKATKLTYLLVFALLLTFAATGCRKKPTPITNIDQNDSRVGDSGMNKNNGTGGTYNPNDDPSGTPTAQPDIDRDKFIPNPEVLRPHTVHFDLDSAVVRSGDNANIAAVAAYLGSNMQDMLLVEGHCDERGTEEYNRSLGSRRALAVRQALVGAGVDPNRITTTTLGEDRPAATGHDESVWSRNRRGEFIVLHPR